MPVSLKAESGGAVDPFMGDRLSGRPLNSNGQLTEMLQVISKHGNMTSAGAADMRRKSGHISSRMSQPFESEDGQVVVPTGGDLVQIVKPVPLPPDAGIEKPRGWDKIVIHPGECAPHVKDGRQERAGVVVGDAGSRRAWRAVRR